MALAHVNDPINILSVVLEVHFLKSFAYWYCTNLIKIIHYIEGTQAPSKIAAID